MNCEQTLAHLDRYLDGDLDAAELGAVTAHLASCPRCERRRAYARAIHDALRALPIEGPAAGFEDRVISRARNRRRRLPLAAAAAIAVLALGSIVAIVLSRTPPTAGSPEFSVQTIHIVPEETRTVNLVFASETAIDAVSLIIELPMGVELEGYPGLSEVRWTTRLVAGRNILPLALVAEESAGGQLIARLRHMGKETVFRIDIAAAG